MKFILTCFKPEKRFLDRGTWHVLPADTITETVDCLDNVYAAIDRYSSYTPDVEYEYGTEPDHPFNVFTLMWFDPVSQQIQFEVVPDASRISEAPRKAEIASTLNQPKALCMTSSLPSIVLDTHLTAADRSVIMGGKEALTSGHAARSQDNPGEVDHIRFVHTETRKGWPILVVEKAAGKDSMGVVHWSKLDLPSSIVMSLMMKYCGTTIGSAKTSESFP